MTTYENSTLREFFSSFFSKLALIRRVFYILTFVALVTVLFFPKFYTISGEIVVLSKEITQSIDSSITDTANTKFLPVSLKDMETEAAILRSLPLIKTTITDLYNEEKIIVEYSFLDTWVMRPISEHLISPILDIFKAEKEDPKNEIITDLTKQFINDLEILPLPGSNVITINFKTDDVAVGRTFVNRLMDEYLLKRNDLMTNDSSAELFLQKKQFYQKRLKQMASEKIKLFAQNEIKNPKEELSLILSTINTETIEYNQFYDRLFEAQQWHKYLTDNMQDLVSTRDNEISFPFSFNRGDVSNSQVSLDSGVRQQLEQITALQLKYDSILLAFNKDSLKAQQVLGELELAKKRLIVLIKSRVTEDSQKIEVLQAVTSQKLNRLNTFKNRGTLLAEVVVREEEIDTQLNALKNAYFKYSQQYEEKRSSSLMNQENWRNVKIMSYAIEPLEPSSPKKKLVLLVGVLASATMAVSLGFICDIFERRFCNHAQVSTYLDLPVIAVVDDANLEKPIKFSVYPVQFIKWLIQ